MKNLVSKPRTKFALVVAGLLAGSSLFVGQPAAASQDDEIVVMAPRTIHREVVGRSYTGAPIEEISLTRRVSYAGLDLRRPSDINELERRVRMTANEACDQLDKLYPITSPPSDRDCKADAFRNGMAQVQTLISSR